MRRLSIAVLVAGLLLGGAPSTWAATIGISPVTMEREVDAGDTFTEQLTVTAPDKALEVQVLHQDFGFEDSTYQVQLIPPDEETTAFSTRGWFELPERTFTIPRGESRDITVEVTVPENTPGGTYLGTLLVSEVPDDRDAEGTQVRTIAQVGSLLFYSVNGGAPPKAELPRFDVPRFLTKGPVRPRITIENVGDEFFAFEGSLTLKGRGKDDRIKLPRKFVVPGEPRVVQAFNEEGTKGNAPVLGSKRLGIGRYVVEARLRIEPTGSTLVDRRTVWIVPVWAWIVVALLSLVLAACVALLVRWALERRRIAPYLEAELARDLDVPDGDPSDDDVEEDDPDFR